MRKSLKEQLGEAFGLPEDQQTGCPINNSKKIAPTSKAQEHAAYIEAKGLIENLRRCLDSLVENKKKEDYINTLSAAEKVSQRHIFFSPDGTHIKAANELSEAIYNHIASSTENTRSNLFKLSAFACSYSSKPYLADVLVNIIKIWPEDSGLYPDLSDEDKSYFIQRAGTEHLQNSIIKRDIRERESIQKSIKDYRKDVQRLKLINTTHEDHTQASASDITDQDIRLIYLWATNLQYSKVDHVEKNRLLADIGKLDFTRLVSARQAEKVVLGFFRAQGYEAIDISLSQLFGFDKRWMTHDIEVNGHRIDVKNARQSFSSNRRYVEHCAKNKKSRKSDDVALFGVLSRYLTAQQIIDGYQQHSCTLLGSVTRRQIRNLQDAATLFFGDIIEIDINQANLKIIQGWLFEYSIKKIDSLPETIDSLAKRWDKLDLTIEDFPLPSLCLVKETPAELISGLDNNAIEDINQIRAFFDVSGVSKRSIFIYLLSDTIKNILLDTDKRPLRFLKILFSKKKTVNWKKRPLGLYDPLEYIWEIIEVLDSLAKNTAREKIQRLKSYRFSGAGILRGWDPEKRKWISVIAYCGGWKQASNVKCGKNPIHMGESENCDTCGHLICPECGFCCEACNQSDPRQEPYVRETQSTSPDDPLRDPSTPWWLFSEPS